MDVKHIYPHRPQSEFFTQERCHIIEVFNVPQTSGNSIAQARVEPGITTANHLLRGIEEWYYILRGTGDMFLNGKIAGNVGPGDVVHIPADTPQFIRNTGTEDLMFLCICSPRFRPEAYLGLECL